MNFLFQSFRFQVIRMYMRANRLVSQTTNSIQLIHFDMKLNTGGILHSVARTDFPILVFECTIWNQ